MTATAHALVGGAIAASISNPYLGITLSAASHPIIDLIPHWDAGCDWRKKTKLRLFIECSIDLSTGLILSYLLFGQHVNPYYFFSCILASIIWDLLETPYWFLKWDFAPFSWVYKIQHHLHRKATLPWGVLTQVATVVTLVIFLRLITASFT